MNTAETYAKEAADQAASELHQTGSRAKHKKMTREEKDQYQQKRRIEAKRRDDYNRAKCSPLRSEIQKLAIEHVMHGEEEQVAIQRLYDEYTKFRDIEQQIIKAREAWKTRSRAFRRHKEEYDTKMRGLMSRFTRICGGDAKMAIHLSKNPITKG